MRLKGRSSTVAGALVVAAFVLYIVNVNRGATPYSWQSFATMVVVGLSLGGIYAIFAAGLVVTYSTTGIFNFAHGAIGCFLAFCYWEMRVNHGWPAPLALFVVLFLLAPAIGVGLDVLLMRRLRFAPLVVQLMVTVGLMLTFMGVTLTIWKPNTPRALQHFYESSKGVHVGDVVATWHRIITVLVALGIAVLLRTLLYKTRLGISMRAVVDNRNLAGLTGARPNVVSSASWALGCMTAGLAGILIAPETGLTVENMTLLIVTAFAAAAIAQLKSLPWAFAGGLIIGLCGAFAQVFLSFSQDFSYANEAIPAVILFIALLFLPQARIETGTIRLTKRTERLTTPWEALLGSLVMVGLVSAWANGWIPWFSGTHFGQRTDVWLGRGATFLVFGLIMMSLVPLIGWAGQVSFANYAIAGFGAAMYHHVGGQHGSPIGIFWVMVICAPLGALIAIPALRLKGLYLALATMAFAEFADKVLFRYPRILNPTASGTLYKPLRVLGFQMSSDPGDRKAFVIFLAIAIAVIFFGLQMLRRSRWARRWIAIADSPAAAATVGINLTVSKVAVFALSGALAGFAGTMLGLSKGALAVDEFPLFAGLPLVLLLAVWGSRYPVAAFMGALGLAIFPALQEMAGNPTWLTSIELLGPGLAVIGMAFQPEGAAFNAGRDLAGLLPWRRDAREEKALVVAKLRDDDVTRDEINDLGLTRAFTVDKIAKIDRALDIADEMLERPGIVVASEVTHGAPVG